MTEPGPGDEPVGRPWYDPELWAHVKEGDQVLLVAGDRRYQVTVGPRVHQEGLAVVQFTIGDRIPSRVWVDFNGLDGDRALSLTDYVDGPPVKAGDRVTAYDGEGAECAATVERVELITGAIGLVVDRSTFREVPV